MLRRNVKLSSLPLLLALALSATGCATKSSVSTACPSLPQMPSVTPLPEPGQRSSELQKLLKELRESLSFDSQSFESK